MKRTREQISYTMSRIRSKDTTIELMLRKKLWQMGLRFRKHYNIIGKPDIAFPKQKLAIFCDSNFWHGYNWETQKNSIKSNRSYWIAKIEGNIERDKQVTQWLEDKGWIVIRFWEHELRKDIDFCTNKIMELLGKDE